MAAPRLTNEQRTALLTWLAAEYGDALIAKWFSDREWTPLTSAGVTYYRNKHRAEIEAARAARRNTAVNAGLALKEERIARLADHADELDAIKWEPDEKGRLWNEKAWRETLDDIAKEMGHRRQGVDVALEKELEQFLDRLRDNLPTDAYAQVLALFARSEAA